MPVKPSPRSFLPRKLLVAALGVATINYVGLTACGGATEGSGTNKDDYPPTSGNLPSPEPDQYVPPPTSGNLPAPPPIDAALDADSSTGLDDAGDGGDQDSGDAG